ncbi:MAG: bifunctional 5,10-methylene-tetrahydrofolate dehydrogenase/5,10-methylene-tetrahydrofolate cyclohydrolase [Treponema sp.]|jgi:methylenetetrahydrofolate dehydrogenase (NADP+)/methenyltetrahydrofolate cyclohydrolase|nr:bifunctional 5,10-methylene-tetrahydrofolate dehydrogenase/5,10-methylene-tetrahydrofolate cyclohydrolase [Treponema sp.]
MSAVIIDGKEIARKKREEAALRASSLKQKGVSPCLAVVLAGEDPASVSYVGAKEKALGEAGMESRDIRLPAYTSEERLLSLVAELNADRLVHGILVQLPLPAQIREKAVISAIDPRKDVDGFHPVQAGRLFLGEPGFIPCTPQGVLELLRETAVPVSGAHVVIVGRSNLVGKPLAALLLRRELNATVTVCHTGSGDLARYTTRADILVAAAGKPGLITGGMIKKGAVVIDVGVNRVNDTSAKRGYRLKGDVDFESAAQKASYLTPVPGGVGPMTIAMLLHNVLKAAESCAGADETGGRRD